MDSKFLADEIREDIATVSINFSAMVRRLQEIEARHGACGAGTMRQRDEALTLLGQFVEKMEIVATKLDECRARSPSNVLRG